MSKTRAGRDRNRAKINGMSDKKIVELAKEIGLASDDTEVTRRSSDQLRAMLLFIVNA